MKKVFFIFGFGVVCLLLYTSCQPEPELSSEKEITAFSFTPAANPELDITATGTLTGTDISVILPYGTDPGSLTADFTATGAGVSVNENLQFSGTTANDFTAPVTYTVIAEDGTTRDYTVTVLLRAVEDSGFHEASAPGDTGILRLGETLTMIYAQDRATITFPTETDDSGSAELTTRFWMGETEVTNAAMAEVLQWAYDNGKFSSTAGDHNGLDITAAKFGGRVLLALEYDNCKVKFDGFGTFYAVNGFEDHPVTEVSWYGAVMFCNWLTEMRDGNTDNVVYTNIDTTWQHDETAENTDLNGYRLPSKEEWEYTARYRGSDSTNTVSGYSSPYFTKGDSASGAADNYLNEAANRAVAVYAYDDPNPYEDEQRVRSLGPGSGNALGLYDMSGNVSEWCFTQTSSFRYLLGGTYTETESVLQIGMVFYIFPHNTSRLAGFRLCRTADPE